MRIRAYEASDLECLMALFRDTVRMIGRRHYSAAQVAAWAPECLDRLAWARRLADNVSRVAEVDRQIVGFAELGGEGYIDMLYVHKDWQGRGIASALLTELERQAREQAQTCLTAAASRNARPFFEARGFHLLGAETVQRLGQDLERFRMSKAIVGPAEP